MPSDLQNPAFLLENPESHPLHPPGAASSLGSILVIAPHPDDESLGCGGLLALSALQGSDVQVVVVTDGSRSHPHSKAYPASRLAALREDETVAALAALGVPDGRLHFLRYPDCGLPQRSEIAFKHAASHLGSVIDFLAPDTILVPWRRDPHSDHESTWALVNEAVTRMPRKLRWIEYPVWSWRFPHTESAPQLDDSFTAWRLDITPVLEHKKKAIAQHQSQLGAVVVDDPTGFCLQPAMLAHFERPWELYLEPHDV